MPAMVWELLHSEFGLIYGYDDEKKQFNAMDTQSEEPVFYDRLGRLQTRSLFVLGYIGDHSISPSDALWRLCRMISRHARGGDLTFSGYINGLAAYDAWIEAFRQKAIEPLGHAYTIGIIHQAREHATICLHELAVEWGKSNDEFNQQIQGLLHRGSEQYSHVCDGLSKLAMMFPAPSGGNPGDPETTRKTIAILETMKRSEESGVEVLEQIVELLERHTPKGHVPVIIENPPRAYVM